MQEPFTLELHRRFRDGESAERLAAQLHIPLDRIAECFIIQIMDAAGIACALEVCYS